MSAMSAMSLLGRWLRRCAAGLLVAGLAPAWADEAADMDRLRRLSEQRPAAAVDALRQLPGDEGALRHWMSAWLLVKAGRVQDAQRALGKADEAAGLYLRALLARRAGREPVAVELLQRALGVHARCAERGPCDERLGYEMWWLRAHLHKHFEEIGQALFAQQQALAAARRLGDPARQADSLGHMAMLHALRDEREAAQQLLRSALALPGLDEVAQGYVQVNVAIVARLQQDWATQGQALERALQLAQRQGAEGLATLARVNLADHYLQQRKPQQARTAAEAALAATAQVNSPALHRSLRHNLSLALIQLREFAAARAQMALLGASNEAAEPPRARQEMLRERADAWALAAQWDDALRADHAERELAESVQRDEREGQLADQQAAQAKARQQAQLALLREQQALQQRTLENQQALRWIVGLAAALVGIGLTLAALLWAGSNAAHRRLRHNQARLQSLADRDPLTQLLNRRALLQALAKKGDTDGLNSGAGGWLMLDIDHFKAINDGYGHAGGDQVLQSVAQRLAAQVRSEELLARWGGEEFLLHMPTVSAHELRHVAQRLMRTLSGAPITLDDGRSLRVTASVGFGVFPLPPHATPFTWERAVNWVDLALYTAKHAGRACAVGIVSANLPDATALAQIEADFEGAAHAARVQLVQLRVEA